MKLLIKKGTTSKLARIFIQDSSLTTGAGLTGLVYNSASLTAYYIKEGEASATAISLVTMTVGTWVSGGFKEVDATNLPGIYEIGIPDACLTGTDSVLIMLKGATDMAPVLLEIQMDDLFDNITEIKAKTDNLPNGVKKNTALANFMFLMVLASDSKTAATGLTITAERSIDGAAFGACANPVTEISDGLYKINLDASDLNGDTIVLKFDGGSSADVRTIFIKTDT